MRITIVCDVLGQANNGTALAAYNLINFLKSKGHNITVVAPEADSREGFVSVPTLNLGKFLNGVLKKNGVSLAKPDKKILENAIKNADVVHLLLPFLLSAKAVKIAEKYNKPITASFHCQAENFTAHLGMMDFKLLNHLTYKTFYNCTYKYCNAIHYPTQFIKEVFEKNTQTTNGFVISNGVNDSFVPPECPPNNKKFTIVCSGRYSREKAQQQLIYAVADSKYKNSIKVVFAGDGPRKRYLMRMAERKGIDCDFKFFSRPQMVTLLQNADLYVHTAVVEIEAIACMEAICCGLVPVICDSPRSATRFFAVDEKSLFELYNTEQLTKKIEYWIENPDKKKEYSKKYEHMRSNFSQTECMQKMENMLRKAAGV